MPESQARGRFLPKPGGAGFRDECASCGKVQMKSSSTEVRGRYLACWREASKTDLAGSGNSRWNGGRRKGNHPMAYTRIAIAPQVYRGEHILIAEKAIGRRLASRKEVVHHINGDKHDNRPQNLLICSNAYHAYLHNEMSRRYQRETFGHA